MVLIISLGRLSFHEEISHGGERPVLLAQPAVISESLSCQVDTQLIGTGDATKGATHVIV